MDIAIIGMAGRFPQAANMEEFYNNLKNGTDAVRRFSRKRLRKTALPEMQAYEIFGYLEDIDLFDNDFFNISPAEAMQMDPHQRLILEVVYQTFENAGYDPDHFRGTQTAVFAGDVDLCYAKHVADVNPVLTVGNLNTILAGRIARVFDLRGSAVMIETACSSSLVALHYACRELQHEDAAYALVCGVNMKLFPAPLLNRNDDLGISSPAGKTKSFSADADGTGSGEVVCSVLLKPYRKALEDNDIIHAVIKGSAVNQDAGLSGSLTAPSSQAQCNVIRKAWANAGIDPLQVTYLEAHGTATRLGDPIEVQGITQAYDGHAWKKQFCAIGSLKSNIGHPATAAGLAGLIKTVLSVKHKQLFKSLHYSKPNPFIDFDNSPVYVNDRLRDWVTLPNVPRIAGVSSFGFSGTNCHVVVAENILPRKEQRDEETGAPQLVAMSARTAGSLRASMAVLYQYLVANPYLQLNDISYTLNNGRKHHNIRWAEIVQSKKELYELLKKQLYAEHHFSYNKGTRKIIFTCLSDTTIDAAVIDYFYNKHSVFRKHFDCCCQCAEEFRLHPQVQQFAFRYSFFRLLEATGIKSNALLGEGIGEIAIAALTGSASMYEAVKLVIAYKQVPHHDLSDRCRNVLNNTGDGPVVFAELGMAGKITNLLQQLATDADKYCFVNIEREQDDRWMAYLKALYLSGAIDSLEAIVVPDTGCRIELPGYQFDRKHAWIKENPRPQYSEWLFRYHWKETALVHSASSDLSLPASILVFMDGQGRGNRLCTYLEQRNNACVKVWPGNHFSIQDSANYTIDIRNKEDYETLNRTLNRAGINVTAIVHLGCCNTLNKTEDPENMLADGLFSLNYLYETFSDWFKQEQHTCTMVSLGARTIREDEVIAHPVYAAAHALMAAIYQENKGGAAIKCIDIDEHTATSGPDVLANEILTREELLFIGYRNGGRYLPVVSKIAGPDSAPVVIKEVDTCVVIGGLNTIGLKLCKRLARKRIRLVIVHDRTFPARAEWESITGDRQHPEYTMVNELLELEQYGSKLYVYSADTGNQKELELVFTSINATIGRVTGIFHIHATSEDLNEHHFCNEVLSALQGINNVVRLAEDLSARVVFFTSYCGITGSPFNKAVGVCDLLANEISRLQQSINVVSVQWPEWSDTGWRAGDKGWESVNEEAILTEDAWAVLDYVMENGFRQVLVAENDPSQIGANPYFLVSDPGSGSKADIPAPTALVAETTTSFVETADCIGAIWKNVLKIDAIGFDDDFFDLGGHSLNGGQIINAIEKEFHVLIDFEDLLDYSTIRTLSEHIEALMPSADVPVENNSLIAIPINDHYEVSHAQRRLWILQQVEKDLSVYNMSSACIFEGDFNPIAFQRSFEMLVARHESLRTTFISVKGEPRQKVHLAETFAFRVDYSNAYMNDPDKEEKVWQMIEEDAKLPFDLQNGPLVRATLLQTDRSRFVFFFTMHHIVGDGWSLKVLQSELMNLYDACCKGTEHTLPPLRFHYKDFTAWQNSQLAGSMLEEQKQYWLNQFGGELPILQLPAKFDRPLRKTYSAKRTSLFLGKEMSNALKQLSKELDATLYMTMLSTVNVLLFTYSRQHDLVIGTPVSGRNHSEMENQIGCYLNTLAIRTRFSTDDSFEKLVGRVRETTLNGYKYQTYPFDKLLEDLDIQPPPGRNPLFDVGFTFNSFYEVHVGGNTTTEDPFADVQIHSFDRGYTTVKGDLWFHVFDNNDDITIKLDYNIALFNDAFIKTFMDDHALIIRKIIDNPKLNLQQIAGLVAADRIAMQEDKRTDLRNRNAAALKARFNK